MPRGASPKREREYEKLKRSFKKTGRYRGRETEVASRIVNKQRAAYGETKGAQQKRRAGRSEDAALPIRGYQTLTIPEVKRRLSRLDKRQVRQIRRYEEKHKNRKGLLTELDRQLAS